MAVVLNAFVSAVMEKLVDEGIKKIVSALGVKSETKKLQSSIENIRFVVEGAESKKIESKAINLWLAEFREVMYDVEDLLDDCLDEADHKVAAAGDTSWIASLPSVPGLSQLIFSVAFRNKIVTKIEEINSTLERLNSQTSTLQLLESLPNASKKVCRYNSSRITDTCSIQLDSDVVGIDGDAADIVDRITGDSNRVHSLFAITGMGGIGKTTLARKVFNHNMIKDHFDNNIVWVCVLRNCTGEYLLKEIVRSNEKNCSESSVSRNELSRKVIEVVKGKRVFIVLDDIWDSFVWEEFLRVPLYTGAKYTRILVTTRNEIVAKEMKIDHMHRMTEMNPSDGWSMLCKIVFEEKDEGDMNQLVDVGKKIVDKCKGLPLAIKVVGGVLKTIPRKPADWTIVLSSGTWSREDLPKDILPSLLLSYEDLPLHLKQCFIYCSLFPKGYTTSRFYLENLWIAEGFIKKVEGKEVEYSARNYYNELVMRNFLQVSTRDYRPKYEMHDLLHSLAVFISKSQYIYVDPENFHNSGSIRRRYFSFIFNDIEVVSQDIKEDCVRTLLLSHNPQIKIISSELLSSLRRLRVLDLHATGIEMLPDSLGTLIHLRFLNISYTEIKELPDSIKNLKNLEALGAIGLSRLRSLPMGISELFNLRCLRVYPLDKMPIGLGNLKNLRILDRFVVNDCTSTNMEELKELSQLTDLSIYNLERVASKEEAQEAAIEKKTNLASLKLHCKPPQTPPISDENIMKIEEMFAGIKLPQDLTKLSIDGFFGKVFPSHMTSSYLPQVNLLKLKACKSLERLPSLGDMPNLERLEIGYAESVDELDSEFFGSLKFPKLQKLNLKGMMKLQRMFEVEEGAFPCLVKLSISDCPKLNSLGDELNHATCLKMLNVTGVHNVRSIENLSSISELTIKSNSSLRCVKNLPSLKIMDITSCPALEDVRNVGELNYLYIQNDVMETLPQWLKNIIPLPKKLSVVGSKELVRRTHQSTEDRNFIQKCLYVEVRTLDRSKYISYSNLKLSMTYKDEE